MTYSLKKTVTGKLWLFHKGEWIAEISGSYRAEIEELVRKGNLCDQCHGTGKVNPGFVNLSDPCPCQSQKQKQ